MVNIKILNELKEHFGKKVSFDMGSKIKEFELTHLKTVRSSVTKQDKTDESILIGYSLRVIELDDEVIIREIIESKFQK